MGKGTDTRNEILAAAGRLARVGAQHRAESQRSCVSGLVAVPPRQPDLGPMDRVPLVGPSLVPALRQLDRDVAPDLDRSCGVRAGAGQPGGHEGPVAE